MNKLEALHPIVSYIKNKTRDLEKEILKFKQEQTDLVEKLKNENSLRCDQIF